MFKWFFGCDVHAKRIILEKVDISEKTSIYNWAVAGRLCQSQEDVDKILTLMSSKGGKSEAFARWLDQNPVAHVLWFHNLHKDNSRELMQSKVLLDTNRN